MVVSLVLLAPVALAQEASPAPPASTVVRAVGAVPVHALEQYRERQLTLHRQEDHFWDTNITVPWGESLVRGGAVVDWPRLYGADQVRPVVMQAGDVLDVPSLLDLIGPPGESQQLRRRVAGNRGLSHALKGVALVGLGVGVGGVAAASHRAPGQIATHRAQWLGVALSGIGVAAGSLALSGVPGTRADRLEYDVRRTMDLDDLREGMESYNRQVAQDLGLDVGRPSDPAGQ